MSGPRFGCVERSHVASDVGQHSTCTTGAAPTMVLLPRDAGEVSTALVYALESGLAVSVQSGGRRLTGSSSHSGGVVIDLSALNEVTVLDRTERLVRVGAGATWVQVARALAPKGLAIGSSDDGSLAVSGPATSGGIGWLVRSYGLTIDHVRAVEVVLADGTVVRTDADHEPELFWAMRGSGHSVAIPVSFEIEAVDVGLVRVSQLVLEADRAGKMLRAWSDAMGDAPRSLSTAVVLEASGRSFAARMTAVAAHPDEAGVAPAMQALEGVGRCLSRRERLMTYADLMSTPRPPSRVARQPSRTTNGLFTRLDARRSKALMRVVAHRARPRVQLWSVGGAVNDHDPDATAYAHRHQNVLAIVTASAPDAQTGLVAAWSQAAYLADGACVGFQGARSARSLERAFPGVTGRRLGELRARFDPDGVLQPDLR